METGATLIFKARWPTPRSPYLKLSQGLDPVLEREYVAYMHWRIFLADARAVEFSWVAYAHQEKPRMVTPDNHSFYNHKLTWQYNRSCKFRDYVTPWFFLPFPSWLDLGWGRQRQQWHHKELKNRLAVAWLAGVTILIWLITVSSLYTTDSISQRLKQEWLTWLIVTVVYTVVIRILWCSIRWYSAMRISIFLVFVVKLKIFRSNLCRGENNQLTSRLSN